MSRRAKLIAKMNNSPGNVRFNQIASLLRHEGFVLFNERGSHHAGGRLITVVVPHGRRKTCHPEDVRKVLRILGL